MQTPYDGLPPHAFWRSGVVDRSALTVDDLYAPKFDITPTTRLATAGSCFAQHLRRQLEARGYCVVDTEPAPAELSREQGLRFGFGQFSARFGNIYTVRQLRQLVDDCMDPESAETITWERNGRWFDAARPSIEPEGHDSPEKVRRHRRQHLDRVRRMIEQTDVFVFTLGLTEAWVDNASGRILPVAPGVIAGRHDPATCSFINMGPSAVQNDLAMLWKALRLLNPTLRMLLTVSPVPLTATASGRHVLTASTYSKAVLRGAAGWLADAEPDVDYLPSYEVVTNPLARGVLFDANLRTVSPLGVATVMRMFFSAHGDAGPGVGEVATSPPPASPSDVVCEEALLAAFAP